MTAIQTAPGAVLPATLRLGAAHLTVADLDRSVAFYQDALGLRQHRRDGAVAALGAGGEDLHRAARGAGRPARRPPRRPLPLRAAVPVARGARPRGPAARGDPHADRRRVRPRRVGGDLPARPGRQRDRALRRPPARRVAAGRGRGERVGMFTRALDVHGAARDRRRRGAAAPRRAPACAWATCTCTSATSTAARAFYADLLGFEVDGRPARARSSSPPAATTTTSGVNTWRGEGVGPAPAGTVGLREWTLVLDADAARARCGRGSPPPGSATATWSRTRGGSACALAAG